MSDITITIPSTLAIAMTDETITSSATITAKVAELMTKGSVLLNQVFTMTNGLQALRRSLAEVIVDIRHEMAETKDADGLAKVATSQAYREAIAAMYRKAGIAHDDVDGSIQSGIRYHVNQVLEARNLKVGPKATAKSPEQRKAEAEAKVIAEATPSTLVEALARTATESPVTAVQALADGVQGLPLGKVTADDLPSVKAELVELLFTVARRIERLGDSTYIVALEGGISAAA